MSVADDTEMKTDAHVDTQVGAQTCIMLHTGNPGTALTSIACQDGGWNGP